MSIVKAGIVHMFEHVRSFAVFKSQMLALGFKFNNKGCNKYVFIHPRLGWVVKVLFGWPEKFPGKQSKISAHFLWPEYASDRMFASGEYYELWFQPKVDCRGYRRAYRELMETFRREKINWVTDNHNWNVGRYQGRPVIIDY
jgi:hypothetical protein